MEMGRDEAKGDALAFLPAGAKLLEASKGTSTVTASKMRC